MQERADIMMRDEAIAWHLRLPDADATQWDDFTAWLEADPRHNDAYEAVCDADLAMQPAMDLAAQDARDIDAQADEGQDGRFERIAAAPARRRWMWPAMAASIALSALGVWGVGGGLSTGYVVSTAPGENRTLELADGTRITMNGGSELALDRKDPRVAELKSGEAQFTVHHDAQQPFTLTVGDNRLVDLGTVFNVRAAKDAMRVEVAEGAVRFDDGDNQVRLTAGDTLDANANGILAGTKPVAEIGEWTRGRLIYHDTPLSEIAADITKARGIPIELGNGVSAQRFTGVIQLDGDNTVLQKRVGTLLGLKVTATADGWAISG